MLDGIFGPMLQGLMGGGEEEDPSMGMDAGMGPPPMQDPMGGMGQMPMTGEMMGPGGGGAPPDPTMGPEPFDNPEMINTMMQMVTQLMGTGPQENPHDIEGPPPVPMNAPVGGMQPPQSSMMQPDPSQVIMPMIMQMMQMMGPGGGGDFMRKFMGGLSRGRGPLADMGRAYGGARGPGGGDPYGSTQPPRGGRAPARKGRGRSSGGQPRDFFGGGEEKPMTEYQRRSLELREKKEGNRSKGGNSEGKPLTEYQRRSLELRERRMNEAQERRKGGAPSLSTAQKLRIEQMVEQRRNKLRESPEYMNDDAKLNEAAESFRKEILNRLGLEDDGTGQNQTMGDPASQGVVEEESGGDWDTMGTEPTPTPQSNTGPALEEESGGGTMGSEDTVEYNGKKYINQGGKWYELNAGQ